MCGSSCLGAFPLCSSGTRIHARAIRANDQMPRLLPCRASGGCSSSNGMGKVLASFSECALQHWFNYDGNIARGVRCMSGRPIFFVVCSGVRMHSGVRSGLPMLDGRLVWDGPAKMDPPIQRENGTCQRRHSFFFFSSCLARKNIYRSTAIAS